MAFLQGFLYSHNAYWMSDPHLIRKASRKLEQLHRARSMGFEIPRTLATNIPSRAAEFVRSLCGRAIYKTLTDPSLGYMSIEHSKRLEERTVHLALTTLLTDVPEEFYENVRYIPCLFQEYIEKAYELRVVVIGKRVFCARIDSQALPETTIDWRGDINPPYSIYRLPQEVEERCYHYMKSYGLSFSTMDFIVTPDGRYVFIENNPNGQFEFINTQLALSNQKLEMMEHLVACLVAGQDI